MEPLSVTEGRPRRRRRAPVAAGVAFALVVAGAVVFVRQSPWWSCHQTTTLTRDAPVDYATSSGPRLTTPAHVIEQLSALPGVGDLVGSAPLETDAAVTTGAGGEIVLSDAPFYDERNTYRDASLDPTSGEVSWNRGQAGQARPLRPIGDDLYSLAAVDDGYRLTVLDTQEGTITGCADLSRTGNDGVGRTLDAPAPDGSAVAVATPPGEAAAALARIDVAALDTAWTRDLDQEARQLAWVDGVLAVGFLDGQLSGADVANRWQHERQRVSIVGIDPDTGEETWSWPHERGDDATPRAGTLVPLAPETGLVTIRETAEAPDGDTSRLVALDPETGDEVWSYEKGGFVADAAGGQVILLDTQDSTVALDGFTGKELWSEPEGVVEPDEWLDTDRALPWGEHLLVPTWSGSVVVLDPSTGERLGATTTEDVLPATYWVTPDALAVTLDWPDAKELLVFDRD